MNTPTTSLFVLVISASIIFISCGEKSRFRLMSPSKTSVGFNNEIIENDSFNILTYEYVYNGGGVAIADFNNDGLSDIYFTGSMVPNKLYLNRGKWEFEDITTKAGVSAEKQWCSGVAVIDLNLDGWKDIYVCATAYSNPSLRRNLLFINKGPDPADGIPVFSEEARSYGVDDPSHTTTAAFLDFDNDGDLDLFLAINKMEASKNPDIYKDRTNPSPDRVDKLFRNDWSEELGHPLFTDVSGAAGIIYDGYSLGVNVTDLNQDGWSDIYVTNDYLSQDLVYINNQNGSFTNMAKVYFQHTSYSAMGNDVVDLNNDGLPDVVAVDMLPEDNFRRKTMLMSNSYTPYINNEKYNFQYQFVRNTLQINQGVNPETGQPVFSDVAFMAGVSATDWSWTPSVADFDNDGFRDVIITNGFPKDVTDRDFMDYNSEVGRYASNEMLLLQIPSVKIENYAYRSTGGYTFEDVTDAWGMKLPSFSNGAAYGDLDNDGDLDYVVSNINDPAFLFQNRTNDKKDADSNWLRIRLAGPEQNPAAFGTKVVIYYGGRMAYWEHSVYRGYLSSVEDIVHFGLGDSPRVDSLVINWPMGRKSIKYDVPANQMIEVRFSDALDETQAPNRAIQRVFTDISDVFKEYIHLEKDVIDFNIQPLLPHKLSQYGPGVTVTDVNNDGLDDLYLGASNFHEGHFMIQNPGGTFTKKELIQKVGNYEELGNLFFDADNDGDQDLYLVTGGYEGPITDTSYIDLFYENRDGEFILNSNALPKLYQSGSCAKAADYDRDGDLDLFIGGRVIPFEYPKPADSYLLRNDSQDGMIRFSVDDHFSGFTKMGMVCDAIWTDFDNDAWVDLIIAGEWMPLTFIRNNQGTFQDITGSSGISDRVGWWNSIASADFDNDGDMDYVAGNLGINTLYKASAKYPIGIYGADFDGNKGYDAIPTVFLKNTEGQLEEFPYFGRGDMVKQISKIRGQFKRYEDFGTATIQDVFTRDQLDSANSYKANYMFTSYIENMGNGKFGMAPLPIDCQVAPVYGLLPGDFDSDGNVDLLMVGNDYGTEVLQGHHDALKGVHLKGNGKGDFSSVKLSASGFCVPGDAKALTYILNEDGQMIVLATQNKGPLKAFKVPTDAFRVVSLETGDYVMIAEMPDGSTIRKESYYGHTFLSQSSRKLLVPKEALKVEIMNYKGEKKILLNNGIY